MFFMPRCPMTLFTATDAAGSGTRFLALMGQQHGIRSWGVMIMGAVSKQCTTFCVREPTPPFLTPYHVRMSVYLHWNLRRTINEWLYINPRNCTLRDGTCKESNLASTCSCRGDSVRTYKLRVPLCPSANQYHLSRHSVRLRTEFKHWYSILL